VVQNETPFRYPAGAAPGAGASRLRDREEAMGETAFGRLLLRVLEDAAAEPPVWN